MENFPLFSQRPFRFHCSIGALFIVVRKHNSSIVCITIALMAKDTGKITLIQDVSNNLEHFQILKMRELIF